MSAKRKCSSDDEDDHENKRVSKSTANSGNNNEWMKYREQLKKSKNKEHDNYDASKFVSQFRKPLSNMSPNTGAANASNVGNTTATSDCAKSHVIRIKFKLLEKTSFLIISFINRRSL